MLFWVQCYFAFHEHPLGVPIFSLYTNIHWGTYILALREYPLGIHIFSLYTNIHWGYLYSRFTRISTGSTYILALHEYPLGVPIFSLSTYFVIKNVQLHVLSQSWCCECLLSATFNTISFISMHSTLFAEKTGMTEENHRPATSHR